MSVTVENTHDAAGKWTGTQRVIRSDAIKHEGRYYCPTSAETKWVHTWDEFRDAGGQVCWSEDQTEIELLLPAPFKFSIKFQGR